MSRPVGLKRTRTNALGYHVAPVAYPDVSRVQEIFESCNVVSQERVKLPADICFAIGLPLSEQARNLEGMLMTGPWMSVIREFLTDPVLYFAERHRGIRSEDGKIHKDTGGKARLKERRGDIINVVLAFNPSVPITGVTTIYEGSHDMPLTSMNGMSTDLKAPERGAWYVFSGQITHYSKAPKGRHSERDILLFGFIEREHAHQANDDYSHSYPIIQAFNPGVEITWDQTWKHGKGKRVKLPKSTTN